MIEVLGLTLRRERSLLWERSRSLDGECYPVLSEELFVNFLPTRELLRLRGNLSKMKMHEQFRPNEVPLVGPSSTVMIQTNLGFLEWADRARACLICE